MESHGFGCTMMGPGVIFSNTENLRFRLMLLLAKTGPSGFPVADPGTALLFVLHNRGLPGTHLPSLPPLQRYFPFRSFPQTLKDATVRYGFFPVCINIFLLPSATCF